MGKNAIELEITLDKKNSLSIRSICFYKIFFQDGLEKAPHPFSISGGDGEKKFSLP